MFAHETKIISNIRITSDTFLIALRSPEIVSQAWPGQFVMLRVGADIDPLLRRPFSICGVKDDLFFILYKVVGRGTAMMTGLKENDAMSVIGPLGKGFDLPEKDCRHVFVAGGIGIAPLIFLAQVVKDKDIRFLAGFASASEIITPDRVLDLDINVSIATDDGTQGHSGFVTELMKTETQEKSLKSIFACGPMVMLKKVADLTNEAGIECQVSLESEMACGIGVCQGCAVRKLPAGKQPSYFHICKDGPVFPGQAIDWGSV